jgi:uncharacterized protein (DUF362 family)/Pyruvate/2-oxoacid:ferredoxin oxidoreductase delta subunit
LSRVVLIKCTGYEHAQVKPAVERGIAMLGGAHAFVRAGEKILLKPNLLAADPPEKCVTTHPSVFRAVGEVFQAAGALLTYGDSPGFSSPAAAARKAGIAQAALELGIDAADFVNGEEISCVQGIQNRKFTISRGVLASDGIISLPKLKTHGLTRFTGCVKNQFGCIPGLLKGEFHVKLPKIENFAQMLVDLNLLLKPRLFIMDGIIAMEGNGPRGGRPRAMNLLMFSADPIALDATACRIIGLNPEYVPTVILGMKSGLGTYREDEIEILGGDIEEFTRRNFEVKRAPALSSPKVPQVVNDLIVPRPFIDQEVCVKCGICIQACPLQPKVVDWPSGDDRRFPEYDYKRCIRCYCCQEMCPEGAISIKTPPLRNVLDKMKRN